MTSANQIALNNVRVLNAFNLDRLQQGDWRNPPAGLLQCVSCTMRRISMPIVQFYQFDGSLLRCHECQRKEREDESKRYSQLLSADVPAPAQTENTKPSNNKQYKFEEYKATDKQKNLLRTLITQRYSDDEEMTGRINAISNLNKAEACSLIKELLNTPA